MRPKLFLTVACCSLILFAAPGLAKEAKVEAEGTIAAIFAPANCANPAIGIPEPLFRVCSVQVECADSSVISCPGTSTCSTGGTNNRCVICDGVQQGCCPATCCEVCAANRDACFDNCPGPRACGCIFAYNNCVAGCTGGCP